MEFGRIWRNLVESGRTWQNLAEFGRGALKHRYKTKCPQYLNKVSQCSCTQSHKLGKLRKSTKFHLQNRRINKALIKSVTTPILLQQQYVLPEVIPILSHIYSSSFFISLINSLIFFNYYAINLLQQLQNSKNDINYIIFSSFY